MTTPWASVDADVIKAVDAVIDRTIRPLAAGVDADSAFPAEALADLAGEGLGVMLMPRVVGWCGDEQRDVRGGSRARSPLNAGRPRRCT